VHHCIDPDIRHLIRESSQISLSQGHIDLKVFMDIYELSHLSVKSLENDQSSAEKCCPNVYNSNYSKVFIKCVKHIYFRYVFDLAIFANAIFIAFDLVTPKS
jgi:hypothetical protein